MEHTTSASEANAKKNSARDGAKGLMKKFLKVKDLSPLQLIRIRSSNNNSSRATLSHNVAHPSTNLTTPYTFNMFTPFNENHASMGKKGKGVDSESIAASRAESEKAIRERVRLSVDTYRSFDGGNKESTGGAAPSNASVRSVAGAGIQHLQGQFDDAAFGPLRNDLQIIADDIRRLEEGENLLLSATNVELYRQQSTIADLCRQVGDQAALIARADRRNADLSRDLSENGATEKAMNKLVDEIVELKMDKIVSKRHVEKAIEKLNGVGGGKDDEASIKDVIELLNCVLGKGGNAS